jgi:hypothetical protein
VDEALATTADELGRIDVPERVWIRLAERAVVGEDLEVVVVVTRRALERRDDGRDVGATVASKLEASVLTCEIENRGTRLESVAPRPWGSLSRV